MSHDVRQWAPARDGRGGEATEADFGHAGDAEHTPGGWGRIGVAVAMSLAVAAVAFLVVAKLVSPNPHASAGSLPALSAHADRQATVAPSVDRAAPVSPLVAPDATDAPAPHASDPTAKPAPSVGPPRLAKPTPPGAWLATRSVDAAEADGALAARRPARSDLARADLATTEARAEERESPVRVARLSDWRSRLRPATERASSDDLAAARGGVDGDARLARQSTVVPGGNGARSAASKKRSS